MKAHLNRRDFLKRTATASGVFFLPAPGQQAPGRVSVTDHGADPSGKRDSMAAVNAAIQQLPREGGTLIFPSGTYRFAGAEGVAFTFESFRALTVEGNSSLLHFAGLTQPFLFSNCSGLQFRNFRIDWPQPPFSQGVVHAVGPDHVEVLIDPEFQISGNEKVGAIGQYDRNTRLPSPGGIDSYGGVSSVQKTGPHSLRLALSKPVALKPGMVVVLRYQVYGSNAITLRKCVAPRLSHVTIHATPGLGVLGLGCTDISIEALTVAPPPGSSRLLSTNADASHFVDCRGALSISGSSFFAMGDDAINAFASYWRVEPMNGHDTYRVSGRGRSPIGEWQLPRPGDLLRFVDANTLVPLQELRVAAAKLASPDAVLTMAGASKPLPADCLVCNLNAAPHLAVRSSEFLGNRARGVVAHSNVIIDGNHFKNCSMAAILLAPDARWMEGPAVENVAITNNTIANCGYARPGDMRGMICVDTAHDPHPEALTGSKLNRDINISENIFGPTATAAIYCASASEVSIAHNTFSAAKDSAAINPVVMANVANVAIRTNQGLGAGSVKLRASTASVVEGNIGPSATHASSLP